MGINAKKQKPEKNSKENNAKEKLERDLRSCMKCKYFWGNDNRCINNEKCGAGKQKTEKQQESKCVGCPYGKQQILFSVHERFIRKVRKKDT